MRTDRTFPLVRAFALLCLLVTAGCNRVDPSAFDQTIYTRVGKLDKALTALDAPMKAVRAEKPVDATALQSAYTQALTICGEANAALKNLAVPADETSQTYYEASKRYLAAVHDHLLSDVSPLVEIAGDSSIPPSDKRRKVRSLIKAFRKGTDSLRTEAVEDQKRFAAAHGILLDTGTQ